MNPQPFTPRGAALGYDRRRSEIAHYFDRTAADAWARLTSDAPVSGIRATVRAGRDRMRAMLLGWLPADLRGRRILDAGCGTGAFAVEAARRGADVLAIDLSPTLVSVARERLPGELAVGRQGDHGGLGTVEFTSGDMLDAKLGTFDHVVAMDSLIHYSAADAVDALAALAPRCTDSILVTYAPRTPLLSLMHMAGRMFPRGDRAPSIVPVTEAELRRRLAGDVALADWTPARSERIASGFYTSHALEVRRSA